jgi:hypothetical protein
MRLKCESFVQRKIESFHMYRYFIPSGVFGSFLAFVFERFTFGFRLARSHKSAYVHEISNAVNCEMMITA